ncbi:MAG: YihY/virulence factor BrkB family protein [Alphaproteobacteria bacterium]
MQLLTWLPAIFSFIRPIINFLSKQKLLVALWRSLVYLLSNEVYLQCAGVAFFGFVSIFPALAAAFIVFGLFIDQASIDQLMSFAAPLLPTGPEELLASQLNALANQPTTELSLKLLVTGLFAVWSGTRGMNALSLALTQAYQKQEKRWFYKRLFVSVVLTFGGILIAIVALSTITIVPIGLELLPLSLDTNTWVLWIRWPLVSGLVLFGTFGLYWLAPDRQGSSWRMSWFWLLPGAVLATFLWFGASFLFSMYVENYAAYDAIFGSITAVILLLLWLYYSTMVFIFGAAFNAELKSLYGRQSKINQT